MKTGLTSVSFRGLSNEEVIKLAVKAGVDGIEWGSDVHVPENDRKCAEKTAEMTRAAGLEVISYGSYFTLCKGTDFRPFIENAVIMGTKNIRIWAGQKEKKNMTEKEYSEAVAEAGKVGRLAAESGITVSLEFHPGSLTATADDAAAFVKDVGSGNVKLYWQLILGRSFEDNLSDLRKVMPYLTNVHVFHYIDGAQKLLDEGDGVKRWTGYVNEVKKNRTEGAFMTEFCKGGLPESFLHDAEVLKKIVY